MPVEGLTDADPFQIGPYRLRGRLGAGRMGVVYLGVAYTGDPFAIKALPRGVGPDIRRRLLRSAQVLGGVAHPRVARVVAAEVDGDQPWLAMQYVAGPSLADTPTPLDRVRLRQLTDGLAQALAALHERGLTHRDVKPRNIILTPDGPVLVDLGIAASPEFVSFTVEGTTVGTPAWMAPEQFGGCEVGPAADVWAWAMVAYLAATGHQPFGDEAMPALAYRMEHSQPDLPAVPDWLRDRVAAALANDPAQRPAARTLTAPVDRAVPIRRRQHTTLPPRTSIHCRPDPTRIPPTQATDWTAAELAHVRAVLSAELTPMQGEFNRSIRDLNNRHAASAHASTHQTDASSTILDRTHELSIAADRLDLLAQLQCAVERIDAGAYGCCEVCGQPIAKTRLKAFPMTTLHVTCTQPPELRRSDPAA